MVEVVRYIPRRTHRLKLACDDRSGLRMSIGICGDPAATAASHEISPEAFNGWPLNSDGKRRKTIFPEMLAEPEKVDWQRLSAAREAKITPSKILDFKAFMEPANGLEPLTC